MDHDGLRTAVASGAAKHGGELGAHRGALGEVAAEERQAQAEEIRLGGQVIFLRDIVKQMAEQCALARAAQMHPGSRASLALDRALNLAEAVDAVMSGWGKR